MLRAPLVTVTQHGPEFVLLTPSYSPPRTGPNFQCLCGPDDVLPVVNSLWQSALLAVDFETRGNDYSRYPDHHPVGIGLAWDTGSAYFDLQSMDSEHLQELFEAIEQHPGRLAHNVNFDGGFLHQFLGQKPATAWFRCTYAAYRHLATEGFIGQKWGLKDAMQQLLLWPDTNEHGLDSWLIAAGHWKQVGRERRARKEEMWRAPAEILGKYCILDAEATYLLYTRILEPVERKFPVMESYHKDFLVLVDLLIEQQIHGIQIDVPRLEAAASGFRAQIEQTEREIRSHVTVAPHIQGREAELLGRFIATEPGRYKKRKKTKEPVKFRRDGVTVSKNWQQWRAKQDLPPEISRQWENWQGKYRRILNGEVDRYKFNIRSGFQLRWLLYECLGFPVQKMTQSGLESVDSKTLLSMGDIGRLLVRYSELQKELGYVDSYLEDLRRNGRTTLHPKWRAPGTLTGRLAGTEPNLQQVPKTIDTMSCFVARPGTVWVDLDFSALEPCITAELSRCPALLSIFGPDAVANDIYLYIGAHIPGLRESILATGYIPEGPSPEALARAKKECKRERAICKTVHLACLAEGTLVRVRNRSWIPIELVQPGDAVWDGGQWVETAGPVCNGVRPVINLHGIQLTGDHKVLGADNEWYNSERFQGAHNEGQSNRECFRPNKPRASWSDVWHLVCSFFSGKANS